MSPCLRGESGRRAVILVLDGVGIGAAPDAAAYGDEAAATLQHVAAAVGGLALPNLSDWGLGRLASIRGVPSVERPRAAHALMHPRSAGKDSTSGHWEIAGLVLESALPTYPDGFPGELIARFEAAIGRSILGNVAASGTEILRRLGDEHCLTRRPILYTSADSVFQLAAHEEVVPLEQLYDWCRCARTLLVGEHAVGRVIARPFVGEGGCYRRTPRRHDFSHPPPGETLLDVAVAAGVTVVTIGKTGDLFANRGVTRSVPTGDNSEGLEALLETIRGREPAVNQTIPVSETSPPNTLIWATLADFDTLYGHRNNAQGFAQALVELDRGLPELDGALRPGDLLLVTADHGNDPTTVGTDHTRECVPLLALGPVLAKGMDLGVRSTFADVGATAAGWLGLQWRNAGESFLGRIGY